MVADLHNKCTFQPAQHQSRDSCAFVSYMSHYLVTYFCIHAFSLKYSARWIMADYRD